MWFIYQMIFQDAIKALQDDDDTYLPFHAKGVAGVIYGWLTVQFIVATTVGVLTCIACDAEDEDDMGGVVSLFFVL